MIFKRLKDKQQEKEENILKIAIEQDLIKYDKMKIWSLTFIKNYWLQGEEKNINYLLRTYKRKMNIAKAMEEEKRIENTREILEKYKNEILEKIEIKHNLIKDT